jgi:hypothetical protein
MATTTELDALTLARDLAAAVRGEVRFSPGSRARYANDASIHRGVPIGLVLPKSPADVVNAVEICRRFAGPSARRDAEPGRPARPWTRWVIFDFSKYMHAIVELDASRRFARVQPGVGSTGCASAPRSASWPSVLGLDRDPLVVVTAGGSASCRSA